MTYEVIILDYFHIPLQKQYIIRTFERQVIKPKQIQTTYPKTDNQNYTDIHNRI